MEINIAADTVEIYPADEAILKELRRWFKNKGIKSSSTYPPSRDMVMIFTEYAGSISKPKTC